MTIQPGSVIFYLYGGATFSEPIVIKDADGTPVDLTNYTAKMQVRRDISDTIRLYSKRVV